jgi:hypothetical protein
MKWLRIIHKAGYFSIGRGTLFPLFLFFKFFCFFSEIFFDVEAEWSADV